jgi:subtilisin family serine protease
MEDAVNPAEMETTGRYLVTYREDAKTEALDALNNQAGVRPSDLPSSLDFGSDGIDPAQIDGDGGFMLDNIGVAVVTAPPEAMASLAVDEDSAILAVEPEGVMYAIQETLSVDYLRGFRDAATSLLETVDDHDAPQEFGIEQSFADTALLTWGLQATKAGNSAFSGAGIKVAVLDTGLFLAHPDFQGRPIVARSFVPGVASVNDGHGHGTHCTGTACGTLRPPVGRRYGIAHRSLIHIGKVLSDQGRGNDGWILAGIDWAVANRCSVISMSLGADVPTTSIAYETAGQRALNAGCLIVAAAGNNAKRQSGQFGFVGRPANSRTFMAVGALGQNLGVAPFSARDTVHQAGTAVDIAGPGVGVYSTWPMPSRYNSISGTSMATPHAAGVAALWAQKTGARGAALWQQLIVNARSLPLPVVDVGRGIVQAP